MKTNREKPKTFHYEYKMKDGGTRTVALADLSNIFTYNSDPSTPEARSKIGS